MKDLPSTCEELRGRKHLNELQAAVDGGRKVGIVLCVGVIFLFLWERSASHHDSTMLSGTEFRQLWTSDNCLYCSSVFFNCRMEVIDVHISRYVYGVECPMRSRVSVCTESFPTNLMVKTPNSGNCGIAFLHLPISAQAFFLNH